eukprot:1085915-Pelagomonas_calceolata.AAC.3
MTHPPQALEVKYEEEKRKCLNELDALRKRAADREAAVQKAATKNIESLSMQVLFVVRLLGRAVQGPSTKAHIKCLRAQPTSTFSHQGHSQVDQLQSQLQAKIQEVTALGKMASGNNKEMTDQIKRLQVRASCLSHL